jgi:hypothetical protein
VEREPIWPHEHKMDDALSREKSESISSSVIERTVLVGLAAAGAIAAAVFWRT